MEVKQIYSLVNDALKETLGTAAVENVNVSLLNEDLSNLTDMGDSVFSSNALDKYVKAIVNKVGKVFITSRKYDGSAPSVLLDSWEYGSVLEKIRTGLLNATENKSWELENGQSYDPNIFYKPNVSAKFYNKLTTIEVNMSFAEKQVKQSFKSANDMNAFLTMLMTSIENTLTVTTDNVIMRTINSFMAEKIEKNNGIVNLLKIYNDDFGLTGTSALKADKAIYNKEFLKYANYVMSLYVKRLTKMSTLFNVDKNPTFTPLSELTFIMNDNFAKASMVYLESDTYHNDLVKLNGFDTVSFWQGCGENYKFEDVTSIDVTTHSNKKVKAKYIIATMFDRYALGVSNLDRRTTSSYNPSAEFYTNFNKQDSGQFIDLGENGIVFTLADAEIEDNE